MGEIEKDKNHSPCGWLDCCKMGEVKAPGSKNRLHNYRWFCLEHVRIHNSTWNYCERMSETELYASVKADVTWNLPTCPMSTVTKQHGFLRTGTLKFDNVSDSFILFSHDNPFSRELENRIFPSEKRAICLLGLEFPVSKGEVKARY